MRQISRSQSLMNKSQDLWYCITTAACQRGGLHTSPCPALHRVTSSTVTKTIPIDKAACSSWDGAAIPYKRGGMLHTLWQLRAAALFPNDVILHAAIVLPGQSSQSQGINIMQTRGFCNWTANIHTGLGTGFSAACRHSRLWGSLLTPKRRSGARSSSRWKLQQHYVKTSWWKWGSWVKVRGRGKRLGRAA